MPNWTWEEFVEGITGGSTGTGDSTGTGGSIAPQEEWELAGYESEEAYLAAMQQEQQMAAQTQASDIQLNPLPSLPSISNVGAIAPTGSINWNAIPGGFQPLPQVAGRGKKLYQLSQFHGGINQKSSPRDISDNEFQELKNVTVSQVGRIRMLGTVKENDESITLQAVDTTDRCTAGYGLFQFVAPADHDAANTGRYVLTLSADGAGVDIHDPTDGAQADWIDMAGNDNHDVAQVYYTSGNGVYVSDANFANTSNNRKAKIYVYRNDINATVEVKGWVQGNPLINSPTFGTSTANVTHEASTDTVITNEADAGSMTVMTHDINNGSWDGVYEFYVSWLFDSGCETGLSNIGEDTFASETNVFNVSLTHSNVAPLGGDKRIEGARIYFKKQGTAESWLLAEVSLINGVKGALDSTFLSWTGSNPYTAITNIIFEDPPEVFSYESKQAAIGFPLGYSATEVYTKSLDSTGTAPTPIPVEYKTVAMGQQGIVFIGNVIFDGRHMPDSMMFSMPGKPGLFPKFNRFDSPSSDGAPITALASFQDTILQFKENAMYVINVANIAQPHAQSSFRNCGVHNPCQVFAAPFGVIFANKFGCFIYDGQKVISLTSGKFGYADWDLPEDEGSSIGDDGAGVPSVGYDPRSQNIIVLKDINNDSADGDGFVYNMVTQSWTEGVSMAVTGSNVRYTNFIITSGGYLSHMIDTGTALTNYTQSLASSQAITIWTKDMDFGLPSQTKKIFKVYITYRGGCDGLDVFYRTDGTSTDRQFNSDNTPLSSVGSTTTIATLTPTNVAQATGIYSFSLYINGSATTGASFEINDISILYRARPIK